MALRKLFLIALKDLRLIFRDRSALVLMLAAPFALTLGMGAVTGRFSGSTSSGVSDIPVVIVNQDTGLLGNALVEMFESPDLASLVEPTLIEDLVAARTMVDSDESAAVIHIPNGFTESVIPTGGQVTSPDMVQIEFYANPT